MHPMYNSSEIKAVRNRLVRLQKDLVEMRYVFSPAELTGLYSLTDHLETLEWNKECREDFKQDITSDRLRKLLSDYEAESK